MVVQEIKLFVEAVTRAEDLKTILFSALKFDDRQTDSQTERKTIFAFCSFVCLYVFELSETDSLAKTLQMHEPKLVKFAPGIGFLGGTSVTLVCMEPLC